MEKDFQAQQTLTALLRRGLGFSSGEALPFAEVVDWNAVLELARRQAVAGIMYAGLQTVEEELPLPREFVFTLAALVDRIEKKSRALEEFAARFTQELRDGGWHPVVMKGPEAARLYPCPLLRESGDLDIYIPPEEWESFAAAHPMGVKAPDCSLQWKQDGVLIDAHPHYFDLAGGRALPVVPSDEATMLMLSAHIRKHCMSAGVGLKQICDMAVSYARLPYGREDLLEIYKNTGTLRWNKLLAAFLETHLHCREHPFATEELPSPGPLGRIVFAGGDLGQHAPGRTGSLQASPLARKSDTALRILRRIPFSLRYAPGELLPYLSTLLKNQ